MFDNLLNISHVPLDKSEADHWSPSSAKVKNK
jgi:hypothetical protein